MNIDPTQVLLIVAGTQGVRRAFPRIDGRWVFVLAAVVAAGLAWSEGGAARDIATRAVVLLVGAIGSDAWAKKLVQQSAAANAEASS